MHLTTEDYLTKMEIAFNWFLGKNRLHQIIYNPCTGGCYDGLEETHVNLNQGAESAISYLLARLTIERYKKQEVKSDDYSYFISEKKLNQPKSVAYSAAENQAKVSAYNFTSEQPGITRKNR